MLAEVSVQLYSRLASFREENLLSRYFPNFFWKGFFHERYEKIYFRNMPSEIGATKTQNF